MGLYGNPNLTGVERRFAENEIIVSKTDLTGKLVYGNNTFYDLAGMGEKQCIGQQHNIIRNPNMPRAVFDLLWETLKAGKEIFAYVDNRSYNGDNYWVFAHVTPSRNGSGEIVGYHSSRRSPNQQVIEDKIKPLYESLLRIEKEAASPKDGMQEARQKIDQVLTENKMTFNQMMFALGV